MMSEKKALHVKKMQQMNIGRKNTVESKEKMRLAKVAKFGKRFGTPIKKGERLSPKTEFKKGFTPWNKGKHVPQFSGEKNPAWKGGVTPIHEKIRKSNEYVIWRNAVFERDNYTCIWCGQRGEKLNADHIKPFSQFPELRLAIDNGRTLCVDCHRKIGWNLFKENNPRKKHESR